MTEAQTIENTKLDSRGAGTQTRARAGTRTPDGTRRHLGAEIDGTVLKFDLFRDADTILGNARGAICLIENHVAALHRHGEWIRASRARSRKHPK